MLKVLPTDQTIVDDFKVSGASAPVTGNNVRYCRTKLGGENEAFSYLPNVMKHDGQLKLGKALYDFLEKVGIYPNMQYRIFYVGSSPGTNMEIMKDYLDKPNVKWVFIDPRPTEVSFGEKHLMKIEEFKFPKREEKELWIYYDDVWRGGDGKTTYGDLIKTTTMAEKTIWYATSIKFRMPFDFNFAYKTRGEVQQLFFTNVDSYEARVIWYHGMKRTLKTSCEGYHQWVYSTQLDRACGTDARVFDEFDGKMKQMGITWSRPPILEKRPWTYVDGQIQTSGMAYFYENEGFRFNIPYNDVKAIVNMYDRVYPMWEGPAPSKPIGEWDLKDYANYKNWYTKSRFTLLMMRALYLNEFVKDRFMVVDIGSGPALLQKVRGESKTLNVDEIEWYGDTNYSHDFYLANEKIEHVAVYSYSYKKYHGEKIVKFNPSAVRVVILDANLKSLAQAYKNNPRWKVVRRTSPLGDVILLY
jgi:hypothetical protein